VVERYASLSGRGVQVIDSCNLEHGPKTIIQAINRTFDQAYLKAFATDTKAGFKKSH